LNEAQRLKKPDSLQFRHRACAVRHRCRHWIEFNDNITLAEHDRISDFILRPSLDFQANLAAQRMNTLKLSVEPPMRNTSTIRNSTAECPAFPIPTLLHRLPRPGEITLRDRLSYQEDNYMSRPSANTGAPYRCSKTKPDFSWSGAINDKVTLTGGYDHYNLWTIGDDFALQDGPLTPFPQAFLPDRPGIKIGGDGSYSFIHFDSMTAATGTACSWSPSSELADVRIHQPLPGGGISGLKFDKGGDFNNAAIDQLGLSATDAAAVRDILRDNEDTSSFYIKFEIDNKPSDIFDHRLAFSKTIEIGFSSNSYDLYHVEYDANWKVFPHTEIGPVLFYEY